MCDDVWCQEGAGRIIGVAQKDQPRLPLFKGLPDPLRQHVETICTPGGVLVQEPDRVNLDRRQWKVVTKVAPMPAGW